MEWGMSTASLTYDEIAERLEIGRKSAQNLARRKGWNRTKGNDGKARNEVPLDALPPGHQMVPRMDPQIAVLETQIEGLEALVEAEQARAAAAEANSDQWRELALKPVWKRVVGL